MPCLKAFQIKVIFCISLHTTLLLLIIIAVFKQFEAHRILFNEPLGLLWIIKLITDLMTYSNISNAYHILHETPNRTVTNMNVCILRKLNPRVTIENSQRLLCLSLSRSITMFSTKTRLRCAVKSTGKKRRLRGAAGLAFSTKH